MIRKIYDAVPGCCATCLWLLHHEEAVKYWGWTVLGGEAQQKSRSLGGMLLSPAGRSAVLSR